MPTSFKRFKVHEQLKYIPDEKRFEIFWGLVFNTAEFRVEQKHSLFRKTLTEKLEIETKDVILVSAWPTGGDDFFFRVSCKTLGVLTGDAVHMKNILHLDIDSESSDEWECNTNAAVTIQQSENLISWFNSLVKEYCERNEQLKTQLGETYRMAYLCQESAFVDYHINWLRARIADLF